MKFSLALLLAISLAGCASDPRIEKYYETRATCHKIGGHIFILSPEGKTKRGGIPEPRDRYYCRLGASSIIF